MENLEWILDGIGTELISLLIGALFGGVAGYKIGSKNKAKQNQKAKNNANQSQVGNITIISGGKDDGRETTTKSGR